MKYSTFIMFSIFQTMYATHLRHTMELNTNSYISCQVGQYKTGATSVDCKNCIDATPSHNIAFWTNIIMIFLIFDIVWINSYTNGRRSRKFIYYSFIVLTILILISCAIMNCTEPLSMLMIKNYMVLSWMSFISYVLWCVNMMCNNTNRI